MITSNVSEVINRAEFEQFFEEVCVAEVEILDELVSDVRSEGQQLVDTILTSFQNEDLPSLQRAAHTLKSSSKIFGGALVSQQAAEIEKLANPDGSADFGSVSAAMDHLQENFDSFLLHLETVVDSKRA